MNTTNDHSVTDSWDSFYPNYNVRIRMPRPEMAKWCESRGIPVRIFLTYDGGGFNGHIFEFRKLKHAMRFMTRFDIAHGRMWIEQGPETRFPE